MDRWSWSPLCSTLLAALVLESEVARADEPRPIGALDAAPEMTLTALLDQEAPAPIGAPIGLVRVAAPLPALPAFTATTVRAPGSAPSPDMPAFVRADDQAQPVRLDAAAVLSLNDLFLSPELWRAAFPGHEAPIRWLEFGGEGLTAPPPPIEKKRKKMEAFSGVPGLEYDWLEEHIELSFNDGIAYKKNFTWRGTNLRLKIWGPVLKGDAGLGVRLRGFQLSGHPVELRARATTDIQDIQIKIAF